MSRTIAELMQKIPTAFIVERARGIDAIVHFKFTGIEAGEWSAVIRDGRCDVAQGIPRARPTITLVADSADFLRVATGQIDGLRAFMDGTMRIAGDTTLGAKLIELFRDS